MFRNKFKYLILAGSVIIGTLTSCEDFLDVTPDNRTEIDSKVKAQELLVSAYPLVCFAEMGELMSDNVVDNGTQYEVVTRMVQECYNWTNVSEQQQDSPYAMWNYCYSSIAAANQVLQYVNDQTDPELQAIKGEALMARAYAHFFLVNVFAQQYNEQTSSKDLGVPYVDNANYSITDVPPRGTVQETYDNINKDIEEGLKLVNDQIYSSGNISKYHFNKKASYAFAARFNLYYGKYEKAIEYANTALGPNPSSYLRNYKDFTTMSSSDDISKTWTRADRDNNFLLLPVHSLWALSHKQSKQRYTFNMDKAREVITTNGPWGDGKNIYLSSMTYGNNEGIYIPKYYHYFEYTDVVAQTGYFHLVHPEFTGDETLLFRAEAYALLNKFDEATTDLKIWAKNYTLDGTPELTRQRINTFIEKEATSSIKLNLDPKFTINDGEQTRFLQLILWFRRCETVHTGARWFDIKRYGLEVVHNVANGPNMVLAPYDLRKVVQIPEVVISAGVQANPR